MKGNLKHLAILAVLIAGFFVLSRLTIPLGPYGYDEADYMFDASLGLSANYTDHGTLPIVEFVREGLTRGRNPSQRRALSELERSRNDVVFYRHWHGPVYYYWLIFASLFAHGESGMRWISVAIPILSCLAIYFGCLWITPGREGTLQAILSSALFLWSGITVGSLELAPHQLFVLWFLLGLIFLAKMVATRERRYFYWATVMAGLAFSTLEVSFVLIAVLLICIFLERSWLLPDWAFAGRSVALFLGTVLVVWPGAIVKLSFLKAFLGMAYLAVFRKAPWGNISLADTWVNRLLASPLEWILIFISIAGFLAARQWTGRQRYLYPFFLFALLMLLTLGRVPAQAPRYALPFMPVLEVIAGCTVASWLAAKSPAAGYGAVGALAAVILCTAWVQASQRPYAEDPRNRAMLSYIDANQLVTSSFLVPSGYAPTIHYYFPKAQIRSFDGTSPTSDDLAGAKFAGILYPGVPVRFEPLDAGK